MNKIIPLFFILLTAPVFGQSFGWVNTGIGNEKIEGKKLVAAENEDIIVVGNFEGTGVFSGESLTALGEEDFFITKYDSAGTHLWSRSYGGFEKDEINDVEIGPNNTIYVCGSTEGAMILDTLVLENIDGKNGFLAQLDATGNIVWAINIESNDEISTNAVVLKESDSTAYISGHFKDSAHIGSYSTSSFANESFFVAAVDYLGNVVWVSTGASQDEVEPASIAIGADDAICVLGNFEGNMLVGANVLPNSSDSDVFLLSLDPAGDFLWSKSIGGTNDVEGSGIVCDDLGNLFIIGNFEDEVHFNTDTLTSMDDKDGFFAKYSGNGVELWAKAFSGTSDVQPKDIFMDNDKMLLITGAIDGTSYFDSVVVNNSSGTDLFIARYDTIGTALWGKGIGGTGSVEGNAIITDTDNNPIVTGSFEATAYFDEISISGFSDHDFFIGKIYPTDDNTSIFENTSIKGRAILYPNPVKDEIHLRFENYKIPNQLHFELTDAQGRHIKNVKWEKNRPINISALDSGLYFLECRDVLLRFYKK